MMVTMAKKKVEHTARPSGTQPLDLRVLGGVTAEQHLRGVEAGMRLLAEIAPGWRLGS
jgi:hypothetical protein